MIKKTYLLSFILVLIFIVYANAGTPVPYTQDDRDRMIRMETKIEEGFKTVNQRIDGTDKRIDELRGFMLWGFGILFGAMGMLMGFILWDRRSVISPIATKIKELEEENFKLKKFVK